jgi:hypothetical protein
LDFCLQSTLRIQILVVEWREIKNRPTLIFGTGTITPEKLWIKLGKCLSQSTLHGCDRTWQQEFVAEETSHPMSSRKQRDREEEAGDKIPFKGMPAVTATSNQAPPSALSIFPIAHLIMNPSVINPLISSQSS